MYIKCDLQRWYAIPPRCIGTSVHAITDVLVTLIVYLILSRLQQTFEQLSVRLYDYSLHRKLLMTAKTCLYYAKCNRGPFKKQCIFTVFWHSVSFLSLKVNGFELSADDPYRTYVKDKKDTLCQKKTVKIQCFSKFYMDHLHLTRIHSPSKYRFHKYDLRGTSTPVAAAYKMVNEKYGVQLARQVAPAR